MAIVGSAVNFGFTGTDGIAATLLTGKMFLQSAEYSLGADEDQIKNGVGALVSRIFYNEHKKATLEYIPTGATIAASITNSTVPAIGTIVSITACANMTDLIATNWVVVGEPKISGSNTSAKKVSLSLEAYASVTAAAT